MMESESQGTKKRLFIAIGLPAEIKASLESLQRELKRFARDAKWVKVDGIHLTLKFLGYVEPERIDSIRESLSHLKLPGAFPVEARGCGFFPNARRPAVLWVGVKSEQLSRLAQDIEDATGKLGFEKEKRAFSPHLTLARFRDPHGLIPLAQEVGKKNETVLGTFTASEFVLYESVLHRQGAEYKALFSVSL